MKKVMVLVFLLLMSTQAFSEEIGKLGYVDLQRALNESEEGRRTKFELEEIIKDRQNEIDLKIKERDRLKDELDRQASVLSEEAARMRMDELDKLQRLIERMISDSNAELQKLQREKEIAILKSLDAIISRLGEEGKYAIIFPSDVILYSKEGIDLTDRVINELNNQKKGQAEEDKKESGKK